jgi:periodic tryptophan protein 1
MLPLQGGKIEHSGEDDYVTLERAADDSSDDQIKASDLLVLAAKTEEDSATLEVWLFEAPDEQGEMHGYVHHDIMLPAFPLCVAWMDFGPAGGQPWMQ